MYQSVLTGAALGYHAAMDLKYKAVCSRGLFVYFLLVVGGHMMGSTLTAEKLLTGVVPGCICMLVSWLSREAFGYGDSILILICGISLGVAVCTTVVFLAFLGAGLWAAALVVIKKTDRRCEIPFIPFLLMGYALMCCMMPGR